VPPRTNAPAPTIDYIDLFRRDAARWIIPEETGDPSSLTWPAIVQLLYLNAGLRAAAWMRLAGWMRRVGIRGGPSFVQRRLHRVHGLEIIDGSRIGGGCYIAHTNGCTIRARSIGENVTIIGAVTIGVGKERDVIPVIGDRVFLGTGCRVLGGIALGNDAKVGANAVVLHDVDNSATVVGIPARPISKR
jgi:serine O-acetyltransferase